MKKSNLLLIAVTVMLTATILSCTNLAKNSLENITEENKNIGKANREYLDDIEHYREEKGFIIELNSQNITALKEKVHTKKGEEKADYSHSIFELELQNSYMKMKLDKYKPEGKEKWEIFKAEFTRQMNELGKEFKDFTEAI